jgi:predicted dithiol-disulfide oxidoreductase (DUF899 family)
MPPVTEPAEWRAAREELLQLEKAHTREYDRINALRRRLPMVPVLGDYVFQGPEGERTFLQVFEGNRQLIVYHFMFDPAWEKGCDGCTSWVAALGDLSELADAQTRLVLVSRAPLEKLQAYALKMGWNYPWYSSFGSDFNFDFGVTLDPERGHTEYNYRPFRTPLTEVEEAPGLSVFFRNGDDIYHTYSTYARGLESLGDSYRLLDLTPWGRQQEFEDSPPGWPQHPTYG